MSVITFIQCGDVHLSMPFSSLQSKTGLPQQRRIRLEESFFKIINEAKNRQVRFLLICGDLYEEKYICKATVDSINYEFGKLQGTHIVMIPGNHDPYNAGSFYKNYPWHKNVHILSVDKPFAEFPEDMTAIYNYNAFKESDTTDAIRLNKDYINIMMFHGTIDTVCSDDRYSPVESDELERYGFDYIATGHFHNKFKQYGKKKTIYNAGSPDPLGFDEEGEHIILSGRISKIQNRTECMVNENIISDNFYKTININIRPNKSFNEIVEKVQNEIQKIPGYQNMLCKIYITGKKNPGDFIDTGRISEKLSEHVLFCSVYDVTKLAIDISLIKNEPGIRGVFVKNVLKKIEEARNQEDKSFYENMLYIGLEALFGNKPSINTDGFKEDG